ncbi:MAG TPA: alpha/beta hydrolase fold domain-containing protein [Thermoanaerobaculia bacterium]|jgi:acetyl esterase|nr:alpha/beta hydrolase fold domain-containing protein [Thermoanaerobaculia bacterium]
MEWRESSSRQLGINSELRDELDPDIRRFVTEMTAAWARHGDLAAVSPAVARCIAEKVRAPWARGGPQMARITELHVLAANGAVRVRCYEPDPDGPKPVLIYLHGGGWTLFSLDTHDRVMREYAARAGVMVAGVDYALSPEAKYPVALEQVVAVARFFGEQNARIAIGGDSAGANLALSACLRLRDERQSQLIRAMVLNYGVFDRWSSAEAHDRYGGPGNMLTSEEMESFWRNYLRDERDADDPLVCPLRADLHDLPRALLVVPEFDLLTEQSLGLADRLEAAGIAVQLEIYRGATHSFLEAVSIAPLADRAFDDTANWLRPAVA